METTRKMMMALTQRRKSWGAGCRVKGKSEGGGIPLKCSRLVGTLPSGPESLHGDNPGHYYINQLERKREGGSSCSVQGRDAGECKTTRTGGQGPRGGVDPVSAAEAEGHCCGRGWDWGETLGEWENRSNGCAPLLS